MNKCPSYEYAETRRVVFETDHGELYFLPVCPICSRYVKMDNIIKVNGMGRLSGECNATCKKCGRIRLESEGYY